MVQGKSLTPGYLIRIADALEGLGLTADLNRQDTVNRL